MGAYMVWHCVFGPISQTSASLLQSVDMVKVNEDAMQSLN